MAAKRLDTFSGYSHTILFDCIIFCVSEIIEFVSNYMYVYDIYIWEKKSSSKFL